MSAHTVEALHVLRAKEQGGALLCSLSIHGGLKDVSEVETCTTAQNLVN